MSELNSIFASILHSCFLKNKKKRFWALQILHQILRVSIYRKTRYLFNYISSDVNYPFNFFFNWHFTVSLIFFLNYCCQLWLRPFTVPLIMVYTVLNQYNIINKVDIREYMMCVYIFVYMHIKAESVFVNRVRLIYVRQKDNIHNFVMIALLCWWSKNMSIIISLYSYTYM